METDKPHLNEQYFVDKAIDKACLVLERIDQRQTNEQGEKNEDKHKDPLNLSLNEQSLLLRVRCSMHG